VLNKAELDFKGGKVDAAIAAANRILAQSDDKKLSLDWIAPNVKTDLAVFQLKAGHADESARLIREVLLQMQMQFIMDPRFSKNPAEVYADSPRVLKESFNTVLVKLGEGADTKAIIDSLIDNTVPKNYSAQLQTYCSQVQESLKALDDIKTIIDSEELKYGDPLSSINDVYEENKSDPRLSETSLNKLGDTLDKLATEAQQMPVGDARPAVALSKLALAANSVERYQQAEAFSKKSIAHAKALTEGISGLSDFQLTLAFSLLKQNKIDEFKALRDQLLKSYDGRERLLIALARFTEATGDGAGALSIYNIALDNRKKNGNTQKPEWFESYSALLKNEGDQPESSKHDIFKQETSTQQGHSAQ
jgi:hypothetical protein